MSSLPSGWTVKPLGDVATLQRGFDLPVHQRTSGDIPVFAANGPVGTHNVPKVSGPGVVTGRSGTLGEVHYVESDYWPLNTALWVKDFHGNEPKWVARLLKWMRLETHTRGTGVPTLNRNLVHVVPVLVPPLEEQRRIAAILDKADAVRRKRKEAIALTEELLRSAFLEMFGDPVTNPKGWEIVELEQVCHRVTDGTHQSPEWVTEGIPFLFVSNIVEGEIDFNVSKYISEESWVSLTARCPIEVNDILYTTVGSYGNAALVRTEKRFCFQRHIAHIKPDSKKIHPKFLLGLMQSEGIRQQADRQVRGVAQKTLNLRELKKFQVAVPPRNSQEQYVAFRTRIEGCLNNQRDSFATQSNLFNSLLQRAFCGEL